MCVKQDPVTHISDRASVQQTAIYHRISVRTFARYNQLRYLKQQYGFIMRQAKVCNIHIHVVSHNVKLDVCVGSMSVCVYWQLTDASGQSVIWNMKLTRGVILVYPTSQRAITKAIQCLY
jgi:hypothetical protein